MCIRDSRLTGVESLHRGKHILLLGAGGQGQAVDVDVLSLIHI